MKKIFLVLIVGFIAYSAYLMKTRPMAVIPYPYTVNYTVEGPLNDGAVVILGDRMSERLKRYIPSLTNNLSLNLKRPLTIKMMGGAHEGLHRSVHELKSLKTKPSLVIYHGATEEFYEKRFYLRDKEAIIHNFKIYNDDRYLSLLMTFPELSRFIYQGVSYYFLNQDIRFNATDYPDSAVLEVLELEYMLYQYELNEMISWCKERAIPLLLITSPINLSVAPKMPCSNSVTSTILETQEDVEMQLGISDFKSAYPLAKFLLEANPGNAKSHHLMGKVMMGMGRFKEARAHFENATAYDCHLWRGSVVFNNIERQAADKNELPIIDFDRMVNQNLGKNILFTDEIYPQELYYEELVKQLELYIGKILKL